MNKYDELILAYLFENPASIRKDLIEALRLRRNTVTESCARLVAEGKLEELGDGQKRNVRLKISPGAFRAIGIEHFESGVRVCGVNPDKGVYLRQSLEVPSDLAGEDRCRHIAGLIDDILVREDDRSAVVGIGFADIGRVDRESGRSIFAVALEHWQDIPVRQIIADRCGCDVSLFNSTDPLCTAECVFGAAAGLAEMMLVLVDERIGLSIRSEDGLFHTRAGLTGELGHVVADPNGDICKCGNRGCMETVAGAAAILAKVRRHDPSSSSGRSIPALLEGAARGEKLARLAIEEAAHALGRQLAAIVNIVGIPHIVIKSPLVDGNRFFLDLLCAGVERDCIYPLNTAVRITPSITDVYAAAAGAAWLALTARFRPAGTRSAVPAESSVGETA